MSTPVIETFITTVDNPYDYFTQFEAWRAFDIAQGHYTLEFLARVLRSSDDLTLELEEADIDQAIDAILDVNPGDLYKLVVKE